MTTLFNANNAPRDLEKLKQLSNPVLYRLAMQLNMFRDNEANERAFVAMPSDEKAIELIKKLHEIDQNPQAAAGMPMTLPSAPPQYQQQEPMNQPPFGAPPAPPGAYTQQQMPYGAPAPQAGFTPPPGAYGAPPGNFAPPPGAPGGYAPPQAPQGPPGGFAPPPGFGPPPGPPQAAPGFPPGPPGGYGAPPGGFAPPQQQQAPQGPPPGFAPPQGPPGGFSPPPMQGGWAPPGAPGGFAPPPAPPGPPQAGMPMGAPPPAFAPPGAPQGAPQGSPMAGPPRNPSTASDPGNQGSAAGHLLDAIKALTVQMERQNDLLGGLLTLGENSFIASALIAERMNIPRPQLSQLLASEREAIRQLLQGKG